MSVTFTLSKNFTGTTSIPSTSYGTTKTPSTAGKNLGPYPMSNGTGVLYAYTGTEADAENITTRIFQLCSADTTFLSSNPRENTGNTRQKIILTAKYDSSDLGYDDSGYRDFYINPKFSILGWLYYSGYYYLLYLEEKQTLTVYPTLYIEYSPKEVEIYEPFTYDVSFYTEMYSVALSSVTISSTTLVATYKNQRGWYYGKSYFYDISNSQVTLTTVGNTLILPWEGKQYATSAINLKNYTLLNPNSSKQIGYGNQDNPGKIIVNVKDFTHTYLEMERKSDKSFSIYSGIAIGDDVLNAFRINEIKKNSYKTISTVKYSSLSKSNVSNLYFTEDDESFMLDYLVDGESFTEEITDSLHKLASGNDKFKNVQYKNTYALYDTITLSEIDIKSKGSLTYDDNKTCSLEDVEYDSAPYVTCSLITDGSDSVEITSAEKFTMTYHFPTTYLGTLEFTYTCSVEGKSESFIDSVKLVNEKTNFIYGDAIDYGNDAQIECYNSVGTLLKTINRSDFSQYLTDVDSRYGSILNADSDLLTDSTLSLTSSFNGIKITQKIKVSYPEKIILDYSKVATTVYISEDTTTFDLSNLAVKMRYHDNTGTNSVVEDKEIDNSDENLVISYNEIDTSLKNQNYEIKVTYTHQSRKMSASFTITAIKKVPVSIYIEGMTDNSSLTYYNNDLDTYNVPTNLTYYLVYNDGTKETTDLSVLYIYRDSACTQLLTSSNKKIIKKEDGNVFYVVYQNDSEVKGKIYINFIEDSIASVTLKEGTEFTLGNKFIDEKSNFDITLTYVSGDNTTQNFTDYRFKNESIVTKSQDVVIVINNTEYTFTQDQITWINPTISRIELNTENFGKIYINGSDSINANKISGVVYYKDSDNNEVRFTNNITTYTANSGFSSDNEFQLTSTAISNYVYDGTSNLDVDLGEEAEITATLILTVRNYFDHAETSSTTIDVSICDINDITGLSLVNVFTDYYVGETFLNENDTTEVNVYYKDPNSGVTKKRRVKLNSGLNSLNINPLQGTKFYSTDQSRTIKISAANNNNVSVEYAITVSAKYNYSTDATHNLRVIKVDSYTCPNGEVIKDKYLIVDEDNTSVSNGVRSLLEDADIDTITVYGYLDSVGDTTKEAHVIFFEDYIPPLVGESNIFVTFPCYDSANADYINKCHFGHLFGNNNAKNRLFLSGNEDYANCDWHSGEINTDKSDGDYLEENGNFTYFEDTSYCFYGQTDNKIVGYDIISNDKMVVLKSKSDKEPTIYYRTNGLIQAIDGGGNSQVGLNSETLYAESYPLVIGNIGAGALSNRAISNFNGDTLFLSSDREIDGLDVTGIIGDSQRYAYTRSQYVNTLIKEQDLSDVQFFTNNKYFYVIFKDYILVTHFEAFNSDTKQYEWWRIDVSNVSSMIEINDEIYYGTSDGLFCKLENSIYQDIKKVFISSGGATVYSENEENGGQDNKIFVVTNSVMEKLNEEDQFYFKVKPENPNTDSDYMYEQIATIDNPTDLSGKTLDLHVDKTNNCLEVVGYVNGSRDYTRIEELLNILNENTTYYLNHLEGSSKINCNESSSFKNSYYVKYKLKLADITDINKGTCFYLTDSAGEILSVADNLYSAALCKRVDGYNLITDIDFDNNSFKISNKYGIINIVKYGNEEVKRTFTAEIIKYSNVKAYYVTAPFTMGNLMYNKTIWGWTITNDSNYYSQLEVCQTTNEVDYDNMIKVAELSKSDYGFNLNDVDYSNINFEKFIIPHKYTFYRPITTSFICFGIRNYEATNAVLCSLQVIYTLPSGANSRS